LGKRKTDRFLVVKPERKNHQEDLDVGERIISKWNLEKQDRVLWAGFFCLTIRTSGRFLWTQ
jgi:hypothetical protein